MDLNVRAVCPQCQSRLRIPAGWVGQLVRCKKCSSVMRSKARSPQVVPLLAQPAAAPQPQLLNPGPMPQPPELTQPNPYLTTHPFGDGTYPVPQPVPTAAYPYAAPPAYPQPVAYPAPTGPNPAFELHDHAVPQDPFVPDQPRQYRPPAQRGKWKSAVLGLLFVGGVLAGSVYGMRLADWWFSRQDQANSQQPPATEPVAKTGTEPVVSQQARGAFPRRLLFIHMTRYMFLNPLTGTSPSGTDATKAAALRLAYEWQVPTNKENNQLFLLSDTAPLAERVTPFKEVVKGTYERFFETSRAQDRVVVYFGGHVVERDNQVFLAPVEGEPDDPETLIPLADFYSRFGACAALQKVVIWDVCRFNPARGYQRPGSEPMTQSLADALTTAPPGVEVILTCQPGENALEFDTPPDLGGPKSGTRFSGSAFLDAMRHVAERSRGARQPSQTDPLPIAEWVPEVAKRTAEMANVGHGGATQTVKASGTPREGSLVFNPDEPPAKRFEPPPPPKGVDPAEIAALEKEFTVPPIKLDLTDSSLAELPFLAEVMAKYKADVPLEDIIKDRETYPFRVTTWNALEKVRKLWKVVPGASGGPQLRDDFRAPVNDALKRDIKAEQKFWADGIAELELQNSYLEEIADLKAKEPLRWQAHYEYARAVVKTRLAYMIEYNKLLGDVLTESLPPLDPKLDHNAYKLVSSDKMKSKGESVKLVKEAQEAYTRLINEHKGTPWAIQAKRDKAFALGLKWQPIHKE